MARRPDLKSGPARLLALVRPTVPPMHSAGLPFVGASLALAAVGRKNRWLRRAGLASAAAQAAFFRHPPPGPRNPHSLRRPARLPPPRPGVSAARADGLICLIGGPPPPAELVLPATPLP